MPTTNAYAEHIHALLRRDAYPHPTGRVQLIQTHISYVFLAGEHVYKLKKPVDLGFVDFTSLETRRLDCEAEVQLNRRTCSATYLGVETVTRQGNYFRLGGEGEIVDYAVHMRRLPAEGMMDDLLRRDAVSLEMIGRLVAKLVDFHRDADQRPELARIGGLTTLQSNWGDNLRQMRAFVGRTLGRRRFDRIERYAREFLEREAALLRRRENEGWVRDGHGDLRSDAVCFDPALPGEICIFDCIEFNERLRISDTGLDVAFLAMDLDFRGRPDLADLFIGLYAAAIGDRDLPLLLDFYKCYRACVRGKVESLLLDDAAVSGRAKAGARRRAKAYFRLAEAYARRRAWQNVLLVMGPTGSGKSVLAGALAARLGGVLLTTDMLRRQQFEAARSNEEMAGIDIGLYAPEERERIYEEMSRHASTCLAQGRGVVLDGTYIEARQRGPIIALARAAARRLLVVECRAPDDVIAERQTIREGQRWTTSQGRWEVYLAQKAHYEPPDEMPASQRLQVDTTLPLPEQIEAVLSRTGRA